MALLYERGDPVLVYVVGFLILSSYSYPISVGGDRMCKKHDRLLEFFCPTDQVCVCQYCAVTDHKSHPVVTLKEEYEVQKVQLEKMESEVQQMIQERQLKIQQIKDTVDLSKADADREIADGVQVLAALMQCIKKCQDDLNQTVTEKLKSTEKQAEGLIKELEREIEDLIKRRSEVKQLSYTEDHLHFLQTFKSLENPHTRDWTTVNVHPQPVVGTLRKSLDQLEETLNEEMKLQQDAEQKRLQKLSKGDGKPSGNPDDHFNQIPFRLREIMKSQELMKTGKPRTRKEESAEEDIPVPHFKRKKDESKKAYLGRMENETNHVLFLTKNQVERKPELVEEKQEKPAKCKSEKKIEYNRARLQRLHQKKLTRQEKEMEKNMFIDKVKFGEVAMAPPTLSAKPRKAPVKNALSKGLLLNSLLGHTVSSTAKASMARKRIMEEERERVVEAYRHLKKQKQRQQELRAASLETLKNL
ncbi:unnamed protein product [Merluccius merluccius]